MASCPPRTVLLLVSGAPGSGKTTLARRVSEDIGFHRIAKTDLAKGLAATDPADPANHDRAWSAYWDVLELLLDRGVSVVADQTTWRGQCDVPIRTRLAPLATLANLHCRTPDAHARWLAKLRTEDRLAEAEIAAAVARLRGRDDRFGEPLELGCPCLEVDTTDGYAPGLDEIAAFVRRARDQPAIGAT